MANTPHGLGFMEPTYIRESDRNDFYRAKYRRFCHSSCVSMTLSMMVAFGFFFVNIATEKISNVPLLLFLDVSPLIVWLILYFSLIRRKDIHYRWKIKSMYFCAWLTLLCILISHYALDFTGALVVDLTLAHLILFGIGLSAPVKEISKLSIAYSIIELMALFAFPSISANFILAVCITMSSGISVMLYNLEEAYADLYLSKRKIEYDMFHDPLTGTFNRNKWNALAADRRINRRNETVLLMMDIDKFKSVNDCYGHDIGDKTLQRTADIVQYCLRSEDIIIRTGGEEFLVILYNTTVAKAYQIAERMRAAIEGASFEKVKHITISIGLSDNTKSDFDDAFKKADIALYQSKKKGRNCVTVYDLTMDESCALSTV
ncbi:diguanylate cyclase [[Clostridium] aminophilum]|uniref:GGDEF domain-containing protein n=1 Tax=[Clostridium] aminophilum TaxID=1526 RepID=UPI00332E8705